jgi:hypothetical protein
MPVEGAGRIAREMFDKYAHTFPVSATPYKSHDRRSAVVHCGAGVILVSTARLIVYRRNCIWSRH